MSDDEPNEVDRECGRPCSPKYNQKPNMSYLKTIAFFIVCFFLFGCGTPDELSEIKTEAGEVYDVAFVPAGHGHDVAVGVSFSGDMTVSPVTVHIPERYSIVFKWKYGKFVIDGEKAQDLYQKLDRGDKVTISYREVIRVVDGKMSIVDRHFMDADRIE